MFSHLIDAGLDVLVGIGFACVTIFLFYSKVAEPLAFYAHSRFKKILAKREEEEEAEVDSPNISPAHGHRKDARIKQQEVENVELLACAVKSFGNIIFILGLSYLYVIIILARLIINGDH